MLEQHIPTTTVAAARGFVVAGDLPRADLARPQVQGVTVQGVDRLLARRQRATGRQQEQQWAQSPTNRMWMRVSATFLDQVPMPLSPVGLSVPGSQVVK